MTSRDVKLIGTWASPFVMRARIALNIKSVDYDFLEEQYDSKSELLLKSNPVHKKIPVLIHCGKPICESLIIVQYIDEVWSSSGPSILPSDPYDRAIARFWAAYIDEKWAPTYNNLATAQGEEARKTPIAKLNEILALLEGAFVNCSKGKNFFGGERIGLVDIAFGCHLGWLRLTEVTCKVKLLDNVKTPNLVKWAEKFCADASVRDVMPQTEKLLEFSAVVMAKFNAPQN